MKASKSLEIPRIEKILTCNFADFNPQTKVEKKIGNKYLLKSAETDLGRQSAKIYLQKQPVSKLQRQICKET